MKGKKIKFTYIAIKQKSNKIKLFDKINTTSKNSGHGWTVYWDPGQINEPENSKNSLNFLHLNIIGISKSNVKSNKDPCDNIKLQNYNTEHCTTEAASDAVLLYNKDDIIYQLRKDLKIHSIKYLQ